MSHNLVLCGPAGCGKNTAADILSVRHRYVQVALADELKRFCANVFSVPRELLWGASAMRETAIPTVDIHDLPNGYDRYNIDSCVSRVLMRTEYPMDDSVVRAASNLLESVLTEYHPISTPRRLLQIVGTEWGRAIDPLLWCKHVMRVMQACSQGHTYSAYEGLSANPSSQIAYRCPIVVTDGRFANELKFFGDRHCVVAWVDDSKRNPGRAAPTHKSEPTLESLRSESLGMVDINVLSNNGSPAGLVSAVDELYRDFLKFSDV